MTFGNIMTTSDPLFVAEIPRHSSEVASNPIWWLFPIGFKFKVGTRNDQILVPEGMDDLSSFFEFKICFVSHLFNAEAFTILEKVQNLFFIRHL